MPLSRAQVDCITSETRPELAAWSSGCDNGIVFPPREEELPWLLGNGPCPVSPTQSVGLAGKPSFHLESHGGILKELAVVLLLALNLLAKVCVQNRKDRSISAVIVDFNPS